jgi:excisionase family DNA binding protein
MMAEDIRASELITLKEAAEYCGLSYGFLRQLAGRGRLKAHKLGNMWVTTKADMDDYLASRKKMGAYREDIGP